MRSSVTMVPVSRARSASHAAGALGGLRSFLPPLIAMKPMSLVTFSGAMTHSQWRQTGCSTSASVSQRCDVSSISVAVMPPAFTVFATFHANASSASATSRSSAVCDRRAADGAAWRACAVVSIEGVNAGSARTTASAVTMRFIERDYTHSHLTVDVALDPRVTRVQELIDAVREEAGRGKPEEDAAGGQRVEEAQRVIHAAGRRRAMHQRGADHAHRQQEQDDGAGHDPGTRDIERPRTGVAAQRRRIEIGLEMSVDGVANLEDSVERRRGPDDEDEPRAERPL